MIIAIDPGCSESAFVLLDEEEEPGALRIVNKAKVDNADLLEALRNWEPKPNQVLVIEMMWASYGMGVGMEVFQTCFWAGRFVEAWGGRFRQMNRASIKTHVCGTPRAKDGNVRAAMIERFGPIGTKKAPGPLYGFKADLFQALAVGVTALETVEDPEQFKSLRRRAPRPGVSGA